MIVASSDKEWFSKWSVGNLSVGNRFEPPEIVLHKMESTHYNMG